MTFAARSYHKSGVVWCDRTPVVACLDSESYRNMISGEMLTRLEDELGAVVAQGCCEPTVSDGFVRGSRAVYEHVAILHVTFCEEGSSWTSPMRPYR